MKSQSTDLISTKAQRMISPRTLDITKAKNFADTVGLVNDLQKQIDAFWAATFEQMQDRKIKKIDGDWGFVTIAERKNWKATGTIPPRFFKQVLDTRKLSNAMAEGKLPAGATFTTTEYLTKRVK